MDDVLNISEEDFIDGPLIEVSEDGQEKPPSLNGERLGSIKKGKAKPPEIKEEAKKEESDLKSPDNEEEKNLPSEPIENDAQQLMAINITKNLPLQGNLENPSKTDSICNAIKDHRPTGSILSNIMHEIAEEAAFIKAWRNENWDTKADLSEATYKRVRMLQQLVNTLVEKEKINRVKAVGKIDFHSENFQNIFKYFLSVIQKSFRDIKIPKQYEDIFFTHLAKEFDGFEKTAEKIYHGKMKI